MSQQRSTHARDGITSSQVSREDEDNCSNKATSGGSPHPGSDDIELFPPGSRSSERELEQPVTRQFAQHLQAVRTDHLDATDAAPETSTVGGSSLMGLTLSPLPSAMLPSRKRSIREVLRDESTPEKDKMSAEIDHLEKVQRKKSRTDGDPSTPRALPITTRDPSTHSDESENRSPERRSERIRGTSRRGSSAGSG
ncbi:hypothetical protein F5Y09DRAFT_2671 [Xylaria sp. FL1042]|nr:hypothetical protein F5Y09DRAFT_1635 [Xylaria sp. FL1042]KAI0435369.1 hypothetical protein F5Y09DRAFT_2671 [Xylaria sp. FL1042]